MDIETEGFVGRDEADENSHEQVEEHVLVDADTFRDNVRASLRIIQGGRAGEEYATSLYHDPGSDKFGVPADDLYKHRRIRSDGVTEIIPSSESIKKSF